jgi:putative MATE family efflux protein
MQKTAPSKEEKAAQRYYRMGNEPIPKIIFALALPSVVSMLISSIYNMADTFFVSRLGTSAAASVGVVMPLMMTIQAAGMTLGVGAASYISRLLGAKEKQRASETLATSLYSAGFIGLVITFLGLAFLTPLMRLLGSTETMLPFANSYGSIILFGAPIMSCSFVMNNALRAEGNSFLSMIGIGAGGILNCILDPIFIFGFKMGIAGAAYATILSQFVSFLILLSQYMGHRSALSISVKHFRFEGKLYREIMRIGTPSFLRLFTQTVATVLINTAAKPYGDSAVAAIGITTRVMFFFFSIMLGFGQGFQPVAGYNFGAGLHGRTLEAFWFTFKVLLIWTAACCAFLFLFAPNILRLFRPDDAALIAIGVLCMRTQALALPLQSWVMCNNMLAQATGRAWSAAILALSRNGICFIPLAVILPAMFGLNGVSVCQAAADLATFLITIPISVSLLKHFVHLRNEMKTQENPVSGENLIQQA